MASQQLSMFRVPRAAHWLLLWVAVFATASLRAESCTADLFPQAVADVTTGTVAIDRAPTYRDDFECPQAGERCLARAYLVRGNAVLIAGQRGSFRCVTYFNGKHQTTAWIQASAVEATTTPAAQGDWQGEWHRVQSSATITIHKRSVDLTARAFASATISADNVRTGGAEGTLHIVTAPTGVRIASFGQPGADRTTACRVELRQIGPWLLANDGATDDANSPCGGMGVTLNGLYQRAPGR